MSMFFPGASSPAQKQLQQRLQNRWSTWMAKRMPPSRHIVLSQRQVFILPTGMGAGYGLTTFLLFLAGVNYDNSLVLFLSFFLASLFVVAIVQTYGNLSGLGISAGRSKSSFAGLETEFEIRLFKSVNKAHRSIQCRWHNYTAGPQNLTTETEVRVKLLLPTKQRGLFRPQRLKVQSDYPLGLCRAWTWVDLDMSCWVYPAPVPCEQAFQALRTAQEGSIISPEGNDDFEGLRAYQAADSLKTVDWKAYARRGNLLTKTYHGYQSRSLWLDWHDVPGPGQENKLGQLCYLAIEYAKTNVEYGLRLPGVTLKPNTGKNHEKACLEALARY